MACSRQLHRSARANQPRYRRGSARVRRRGLMSIELILKLVGTALALLTI